MELLEVLKTSQSELLNILPNCLLEAGYTPDEILATDDYIYARGVLPVMLIAHLDTVHCSLPTDSTLLQEGNTISSPETGLGADDRAGVFAILQLLEGKPYILFTKDEECGLQGARKACDEIQPPDVKFIIELDRRGKDDCVFYGCHNDEFINFIEDFGFKYNEGTSSDIKALCPKWNIAGVNLSIGYYNAHKLHEILRVDEMYNTIDKVKDILKNLPEEKFLYYCDNDSAYAGI